MTIRAHLSLWLICIAFIGALFLVMPTRASAATGSDGTTCAFVMGITCIGYDAKGHGTAIGTDLNADNMRINGCDRNNTNIPNIGTFGATAVQLNVVPVYDDAVALNTGYLVYKACVLDSVAAGLKQLSTNKIVGETLKTINTGDNGNPLIITNQAQARAAAKARTDAEIHKDYNTGTLNPLFKDAVVYASKVQDAASASGQFRSYSSTFGNSDEDKTKLQNFLGSNFLKGGGLSSLWKVSLNPANTPWGATLAFTAYKATQESQSAADEDAQYIAGNGYVSPKIPVPIPTDNPNEDAIRWDIATPGTLMAEITAQAVGSGLRQQENAQTIDQLIEGTFASLSAHIASDPKGLAGVSTPDPAQGGQSYLDQMFQAILALIQKVGSTPDPTPGGSAFAQLSAALAKEQAYLSARQQVQTFFGTQSDKFTSTQNACWITLAHAVSLIATSTPYTVATSTTYATAATTDIITPLGLIMSQDIDHSTSTIAVLQTLIASVASSTSRTAEAAALAQLAALTANHTLHTTAEITVAQHDVTDISANIGVKVDATIATWKQGTGWCNASSTAVVQSWLNTWR